MISRLGGKALIIDLPAIAYTILFVLTLYAMLLYYRKIREGSKEYAKAKSALNEIVLSFNKQLEQNEVKLREVSDKAEKATVEGLRTVQETSLRIAEVKNQVSDLVQAKESLFRNYDSLKGTLDSLSSQQGEILGRVSRLEPLLEGLPGVAGASPELPISIARDKALALLTETELRILQLLSAGGERTTPQIRDEIGLTREHTARLMKRLYGRGYIERRTDKVPYVYALKKEMGDLMRGQNIRV